MFIVICLNGDIFCFSNSKNKQRKVAHASRSGSCITDGTTKVFVPLTDEKERETQEVAVVLGNETAGGMSGHTN